MRQFRVVLALIFAGLLAAACLPVTTRYPVGTTIGLSADAALIGTWRVVPAPDQKQDKPGYLHILSDGKGGLLAVLINPGNGTARGDLNVYAVSAAQLGALHIVNAHELYDINGPAGEHDAANFPMLYRFDGKRRLRMILIDEAAAKAAVAAGQIDGTIGAGDDPDIALTADPAKLDAFFASPAGAALFEHSQLVLRLVKVD